MPQLLEILNSAGEYLQKKGSPSPRLDAEVLLADILGMQRIDLYAKFDRPLDQKELALYRKAIAKRANMEPVAYIIGRKEFYSREFTVTPDVLIPRPDTEVIVEKVISYAKSFGIESPEILDLCTGSGAIAITLKLEIPSSQVTATEISEKALEIARKNAAKLGADVSFVQGDLYAGIDKQFDIIVSNPPYIKSQDIEKLEVNVSAYEPRMALDGGQDGLDFYRRIISESGKYLKRAGAVFLEIGDDQAGQVASLAEKEKIFAPAMVIKDLAGRNRGVYLKRVK